MKPATLFVFENASYNPEKRVFFFSYRVEFDNDGPVEFQEMVQLPQDKEIHSLPEPLIQHILNNLHLILGISYWKIYAPQTIELGKIKLSEKQAEFWTSLYTTGMGEFFYRNQLDFRNYVNFPFSNEHETDYFELDLQERSLVGIGGGKDSLVSAELLKSYDMPFSGFVVENDGQKTSVQSVIESLEIDALKVVRYLDPKLTEITDGYKGHIPISAIYAFLGVTCALMFNYKYVIVSNERSANEGNVEYLGETVNHQWSKSVFFERMFEEYVQEFISPDVQYFSLLRPFSELKVMEMFSHYPQYFHLFSSCNRNFRMTGEHENNLHWCGECAKCAFSFIMMAAYVDKNTVVEIFGKNMLADDALLPLYNELTGVEGIKPFDCVGSPSEVKVAFTMVQEKGEFNDDSVMKRVGEVLSKEMNVRQLKAEVFMKGSSNLIPSTFTSITDSL